MKIHGGMEKIGVHDHRNFHLKLANFWWGLASQAPFSQIPMNIGQEDVCIMHERSTPQGNLLSLSVFTWVVVWSQMIFEQFFPKRWWSGPLEHMATGLRPKSFHICILGYQGYVPRVCWNFHLTCASSHYSIPKSQAQAP